MEKSALETIRRITGDDRNYNFFVKPDRDGLGLVHLEMQETGQYFAMSTEQARLVSKALLLCADEVDASHD